MEKAMGVGGLRTSSSRVVGSLRPYGACQENRNLQERNHGRNCCSCFWIRGAGVFILQQSLFGPPNGPNMKQFPDLVETQGCICILTASKEQ